MLRRCSFALRSVPCPLTMENIWWWWWLHSVPTDTFDRKELVVAPFDATHPIVAKQCGVGDFQLFHTAPIFSSGWALVGELDKYTITQWRCYALPVS